MLIAFGLASSGGGSGISARLERYASGKPDKAKAAPSGQGAISELIAQSEALASLNKVVEQRDFGANLSRDLARADLKLKPSEFLMIWGGAIVGIPVVMLRPVVVSPALGNPIVAPRSARSSASCCRASGSAAARAAGSTPSTSSCRTRSP